MVRWTAPSISSATPTGSSVTWRGWIAPHSRDGLVRDAVERCLERVCEAAFRLEERAQTLMPDQPWAKTGGMGNRLRHASDRISEDVIWNAVRHDLPGLVADAQRALDQLRAERGGAG